MPSRGQKASRPPPPLSTPWALAVRPLWAAAHSEMRLSLFLRFCVTPVAGGWASDSSWRGRVGSLAPQGACPESLTPRSEARCPRERADSRGVPPKGRLRVDAPGRLLGQEPETVFRGDLALCGGTLSRCSACLGQEGAVCRWSLDSAGSRHCPSHPGSGAPPTRGEALPSVPRA